MLTTPSVRPTFDDIALVGHPAVRRLMGPSALRPYVQERLEEVDGWATGLRDRLAAAEEESREIAGRVEENDARRAMVVAASERFGCAAVSDVVAAGIEGREDAARIDHRIVALEERLAGLVRQQVVLRLLSDQLDAAGGLDQAAVPPGIARHHEALRQMLRLVDDEFDRAETELQAGAIRSLTNLVLETEVVGHSGPPPMPAALGELRLMAEQAYRDLLDFAAERRPSMLNREGLVAAVRALAAAVTTETGVAVRVQVVAAERELDRDRRSVLYRVVGEAVANAVRHSRAPVVDVVLSYPRDRVVALVRDLGEGFDVAATEARLGRSGGMGLITMRHRAHGVGARLDIRSQVGRGCEVRLAV